MQWVTDLTPYFADRCWQYVLLARQAPVGVIIRSGPSKWWHLTLWDTQRDKFTSGQWFHGSFYPAKCDLSPDGTLFSYFAGKHRLSDRDAGYGYTWIAVSRPPYFTALALWPVGDTWGGHTAFADDGSFHAGVLGPPHPSHPAGPLQVHPHSYLKLDDPFLSSPAWARTGWRPVPLPAASRGRKESWFDPQLAGWRKTVKGLSLVRSMPRGEDRFPSRRRSLYVIAKADGVTELAQFEAHWADFDQHRRLVALVGGRLLEGSLDRHHALRWREIAAFQDQKPERLQAPDWAQRW